MLVLCAITSACADQAVGQQVDGTRRFYADDPVWEDDDRIDVPEPSQRSAPFYYNLIRNTLTAPGEADGPARNVNTLGEVPNSSWYTNRHYRRPMSLEELSQGPDPSEGPSRDGPWRVVAAKSEGAARGFEIVDAEGTRYLLKFDPKAHPEMTTGAEAITTKLLHALGYHVPDNEVAYFQRDRLVAGEEATFTTGTGDSYPLEEVFIDSVLAHVPQYEEGRYRALASRFLEGTPVGPFAYSGTRGDDPNDIYPHEARRELRGLRLAGAWTDNYDLREGNTLDMYVERDGRRYVRHHLIDFGSSLGSGATGPKQRWLGHEYAIEAAPILIRTLSLGFGASRWATIDYPEAPALGRLEAEHFEATEWKPMIPNPAFVRMDRDDAFWIARQIVNVTDEQLRAVVEEAEYSDPEVAERVTNVLATRRDQIGAAYLDHGGGLDRFRVEGEALRFTDLPRSYGMRSALPERTVRWYRFENESDTRGEELLAAVAVRSERISLPAERPAYLLAEIATAESGSTRVYLRKSGRSYEVVGIERDAEP